MRLQLLGNFVLEDAGLCIALPIGMQRLLAFLALRGPSQRCVVAGTLWPEVVEAQALACLRTSIWRLNRMALGVVAVEGGRLGTAESMSIDVREQELFTTQLLRDQLKSSEQVSTYLELLRQRELLPGWYEDWVVFERERLSQLRLHALEYTAVVMIRAHQLRAALQLALEAVREEPLRETANAVLIQVYLTEGNIFDAIHQYEMFRGLLQRELGLEPSQSLRDLMSRQLAR